MGLDEVGRGALAGPLVVAAVSLPVFVAGITDSKIISPSKRQQLSAAITSQATVLRFGQASPEEIDTMGITAAQALAYERALDGITADLFLTDFYTITKRPFMHAIKGDQLFYQVAAASIVAKVYRDTLMQQLAVEFPAYDWQKNAGYGTKNHFAAIQKSGLTPHHRKSFMKYRDGIFKLPREKIAR